MIQCYSAVGRYFRILSSKFSEIGFVFLKNKILGNFKFLCGKFYLYVYNQELKLAFKDIVL